MSLGFFQLSKEERGDWRNDPRTELALKWVAEMLSQAYGDLVSAARGSDVLVVKFMAGRHEMAEKILQRLATEVER